MPHNYRIKVEYDIISGEIVRIRDTEKVYVKTIFYCPGLNEEYESKIPIYFSRNEKIRNVKVKNINMGFTFVE